LISINDAFCDDVWMKKVIAKVRRLIDTFKGWQKLSTFEDSKKIRSKIGRDCNCDVSQLVAVRRRARAFNYETRITSAYKFNTGCPVPTSGRVGSKILEFFCLLEIICA